MKAATIETHDKLLRRNKRNLSHLSNQAQNYAVLKEYHIAKRLSSVNMDTLLWDYLFWTKFQKLSTHPKFVDFETKFGGK